MYYIVEHKYKYQVLSIIQLFYFGQHIQIINTLTENETTIRSYINNKYAICEIYKDKKIIVITKESIENLQSSIFSDETARLVKLVVFRAIKEIRELNMPWGILTGIRPAKKIGELLNEGYNIDFIKKLLKEKYLAKDEKINIAIDIALVEQNIIKENKKNKISIYIGIPFCPTRCVYCSFTSFNLNQYIKKVDTYLDALEKEIKALNKYINKFDVESIYIGGGTPTSLDEKQFNRFLNIIRENIKKPKEYTIEAGRADTITKIKLEDMLSFGATRISINPQTLNDKTLKIIGRNHLEKDFNEAFFLAREVGHNNINTDIILGLTDEKIKDVLYTLDGIKKINPESLTVHTLALKRASKLKKDLYNFNPSSFYEMQQMVNYSSYYAQQMGMIPYYMYRQKNMIGNFENVGYCKKGLECIYNIQIMEEKQTIISFGAGATSKFYFEENNLIKRIFNTKSVEDYIERIDEMIYKKINIIEKGEFDEKTKRNI